MELIEIQEMGKARRAELEGDEVDPWESGDNELRFEPKLRHLALQDDDGTLVAAAGMVVREVQVGDARLRVLGIGGVIVRHAFRGRGLGREVVNAVLERGQGAETPFAVLFCLPNRMGFYRRLGFAEVEAPVRVRQPGGYETMPLRTMWRALDAGAAWPVGEVVLHSLPF